MSRPWCMVWLSLLLCHRSEHWLLNTYRLLLKPPLHWVRIVRVWQCTAGLVKVWKTRRKAYEIGSAPSDAPCTFVRIHMCICTCMYVLHVFIRLYESVFGFWSTSYTFMYSFIRVTYVSIHLPTYSYTFYYVFISFGKFALSIDTYR